MFVLHSQASAKARRNIESGRALTPTTVAAELCEKLRREANIKPGELVTSVVVLCEVYKKVKKVKSKKIALEAVAALS